jgi:hypothetical protein
LAETIMRFVPLSLVVVLVAGCGGSRNEVDTRTSSARYTYTSTAVGQKKDIGRFTSQQVEDVRARASVLRFPLREKIILRFVPADVHPVPLWFVDEFAAIEGKPLGGIVQDYWLNSDSVLRVGTSYHRTGNQIEWMQLLSSREALDVLLRPPYNRLKAANQPAPAQRP